MKTLLLESSDCIRVSDLFTGHAVLPIKDKVSLISFLAVEKCFKMHPRPLKAENLKGKYKKFTRLFSSVSWNSSLPPFQENLVWGIWNFKASNSSSEMSGWSQQRGRPSPQVKLSSPLITNTNQQKFREPGRNPLVYVAKCLVLSGSLGFWKWDLHTDIQSGKQNRLCHQWNSR